VLWDEALSTTESGEATFLNRRDRSANWRTAISLVIQVRPYGKAPKLLWQAALAFRGKREPVERAAVRRAPNDGTDF